MGPHQGRAEGKQNLPQPAGHTPLNAPQDSIGLLGNQGTLQSEQLFHRDPAAQAPSYGHLPMDTELGKRPRIPCTVTAAISSPA